MSHTKEPWRIGSPPTNGEQTIGDLTGMMVAVTTTGYGVDSNANARRIVACVNALKNVSTEWLEAQSEIVCLGSPIKDRFLGLEKQRDELLAAFEGAANYIDRLSGDSSGYRIAIASMKGGA